MLPVLVFSQGQVAFRESIISSSTKYTKGVIEETRGDIYCIKLPITTSESDIKSSIESVMSHYNSKYNKQPWQLYGELIGCYYCIYSIESFKIEITFTYLKAENGNKFLVIYFEKMEG